MYRMTVQYGLPDDAEKFDRHYFDRHVTLCRSLPGLVAATYSMPKVLGPGSAPYLVAELDFADVESFKVAMKSAEMADVASDAETLPAERVMFTGEVTTG